jgi:hypothetical protein
VSKNNVENDILPSMTSPCFSVLAKAAYFHDLANRIAKTAAGDSVTLVTMSFELSEPAVSKLMDLLRRSKARCTYPSAGRRLRFLRGTTGHIGSKLAETAARNHTPFKNKA